MSLGSFMVTINLTPKKVNGELPLAGVTFVNNRITFKNFTG